MKTFWRRFWVKYVCMLQYLFAETIVLFFQKSYARSETHLTELLEKVCDEVSDNYVEAKDAETGEPTLVFYGSCFCWLAEEETTCYKFGVDATPNFTEVFFGEMGSLKKVNFSRMEDAGAKRDF